MPAGARNPHCFATLLAGLLGLTGPLTGLACEDARARTAPAVGASARASSSQAPPSPVPSKVDVKESALGTSLHFIAYTSAEVDEAGTRAAIAGAVSEIKRLESILSEWQDQSEVGQLNAQAGQWRAVGPETLEVVKRGLDAGRFSQGSFDITFQPLSAVWRFGSAQEATPRVPSKAEVERLRRLVDYRKVELDLPGQRVRLGAGQKLGLGGIAKGYILDRAVTWLRTAGVHHFLAQAGGDLYGSGKKPDGSAWVSGVQDPRGPQGDFFATIELTDHAFSTAGDYARSYVVGGKRYHHIIDPKTGFPAMACRSVTIWAPDATTADAVDDAVFILGPKRGLALVESLEGVGALIVDRANRVFVSARLKDRVKLLKPPTEGI